MKTTNKKETRWRIMRTIIKITFSFFLMLVLVYSVPRINHPVYAALLEDCDLDGYDDATGVPVPWPGYDETKGDTPDGPGGSSPSATSSSDTANDNSKIDFIDNSAANSESNTDTNSSGANSSVKEGVGNSTDNGTLANNSDDFSDSQDINTSDSENRSFSGSNTNNSASIPSGKTTGTATTDSKRPSGTNPKNVTNHADSTESSISAFNKSTEKTNTTTNDNTVPTTDNKIMEGAESEASGKTVIDESATTDNFDNSIQGDEGITANTTADFNGTLDIKEATGSLFHAGGSIVITGSGFQVNTEELVIEIHSKPQQLSVVSAGEDGNFEIETTLPKDLESGIHLIVVLYQGNEIASQQIEVGPKTADSFIQAISVGFSKENSGLMPGLVILSGLLVLGLTVLTINRLIETHRDSSRA